MVAVLLVEALPAIRYNGWGFFTGSIWQGGNPYGTPTHAGGVYHLPGAKYGAWPIILGTIESSALALIVGFPVAVGAAILLVEKLPRRLAAVIGLFLEILAGIPSAVIGIFGILTFGPWLAKHIYPTLTHLPNVPVLNIFRGVPSSDGEGLLTGGLVLAAMILPIIAATSRDLLLQVPDTTKEAAVALGMTNTEAFWTVQARWIRSGVIGAAVLGLGRALGETIAIALVSGGVQQVPTDIYSPMSTIAATIVLQLSSAQGDPTGLAVKVLAEAALVLLVITLIVNVIARMIVKRAAKGAALPLGAGF
jgi:phosphate transport system permease protein